MLFKISNLKRKKSIQLNNSVAKTFASGKTEKYVYQCMKEVNLPFEKVNDNQIQNFHQKLIYSHVKFSIE